VAAYELVWTETFLRTARKFIRKHPELAAVLQDCLRQLEEDPHHPRLKLHRLKGRHRDKHAVRLTYSHRLVLILNIREHEIILMDIGTHDEVYRSP
jgi:mRNA-degrading endonuclease YafQ of YafQ-DinJ toxin-antitoxin module